MPKMRLRPAGGAYSTPPDSLAGNGGGAPGRGRERRGEEREGRVEERRGERGEEGRGGEAKGMGGEAEGRGEELRGGKGREGEGLSPRMKILATALVRAECCKLYYQGVQRF